jgi:hypothetical protein
MIGSSFIFSAYAGDDPGAFPGGTTSGAASPAINNQSGVSDSSAAPHDSASASAPASSEKSPLKAVARDPVPIIQASPVSAKQTGDSLGGDLPRVIEARARPYRVTSDIYVPSGKTVIIKPGVVVLFKNFTELHIEGCLIAEGTIDNPIVFTSEFDTVFNRETTLLANPYDWNGIFIHENGLGSRFSHCTIQYTVYGINSLTKYIKIDQVTFRGNGRADLTIQGTKEPVVDKPYSYSLTLADAKKDGVPVTILMDPLSRKRNEVRYGGSCLLAGGLTLGIWSVTHLHNDQQKLDQLNDKTVIDENSPLVSKSKNDRAVAEVNRDRDRWLTAAGCALAVIGAAGFTLSFRF